MIDVARHAPARVIRCFRWALLAPPDQYLVRRSLLNFVLSVSVSLAIVAVAVGIGRLAGAFEHPPETSGAEASLHFFVGAVLVAPVIETWLLSLTLWLLVRFEWSILATASLAGLVWGGFHALVAPFWFFGTFFGFFVYSCCYLVWRPRSYRHAFLAAALPHGFQNLSVVALVALPT